MDFRLGKSENTKKNDNKINAKGVKED